MGTTASVALLNPRNIRASNSTGLVPIIDSSEQRRQGMLEPNQLKSNWMLGVDLIPHLERGDLIEIRRSTYTHWVVFIGYLQDVPCVVHISTDTVENAPKKELKAKFLKRCSANVRSDPFLMVANQDSCRINNSLDAQRRPFPPSVIVERTINKLGTGDYNILKNNCEHFAKWCRYALRESEQSLIGQASAIGLVSLALTSFPSSLAIGSVGYAVLKAKQALERNYIVRSII